MSDSLRGPAWMQNRKAREFFRQEAEAMAERFPQFRVRPSQKRPNSIAWTGPLRTNYGNDYVVEVVHRDGYPGAGPSAFVLQPAIRSGAPRLLPDGSLCLRLAHWSPYRSTAVNIVGATAQWLVLYDRWRATGERW